MLYYLKINYPTQHPNPSNLRAKDAISDLVLGAIGARDGPLVRLPVPEPPLEYSVFVKELQTHHKAFVQLVIFEYSSQLVPIRVN